MTAAATDANGNNDNCYWCHSLLTQDDKAATTPDILQQWTDFYNSFLHSVLLSGASTSRTNEGKDD